MAGGIALRGARAATLLGALLAAVSACGTDAAQPFRFEGATMGTAYRVTVVDAPAGGTQRRRLAADVHVVIDEVDRLMSTWKSDSEITAFNRAGAGANVPASAATLEVVGAALEIAALSGGAFDPTVLPLVDAWGFGPKEAPSTAPGPAELAAARRLVGHDAVQIDLPGGALRKTREGTQLDLSGIAKGYAVDRAAVLLLDRGHRHFLVEIGGEVRTAGSNPAGEPWRIGLDSPLEGSAPGDSLQDVVELPGLALATSGDYRNYRELDGRRVSHTLDPRTGEPIAHRLASVSVMGPDCMRCDALATALSVLGSEAGLELVESLPEFEAYLVERLPGDSFRVRMSSGMAAALKR